tara:strand:- start:564 stop:1046 length:483 start_codon:yes stop_codon:yes gene_type:complete
LPGFWAGPIQPLAPDDAFGTGPACGCVAKDQVTVVQTNHFAVFLPTLLLFALGLTPYFYLVTPPNDLFGVYGPINTFNEFVDYVSRSSYNDDKSGATIADKLAFLSWLPLETIRQIGFPLSLLAALGVYYSFKTAPSPPGYCISIELSGLHLFVNTDAWI